MTAKSIAKLERKGRAVMGYRRELRTYQPGLIILGFVWPSNRWYPLVNQHNYEKSPFLMGKSTVNGYFMLFSIAMSVYQMAIKRTEWEVMIGRHFVAGCTGYTTRDTRDDHPTSTIRVSWRLLRWWSSLNRGYD